MRKRKLLSLAFATILALSTIGVAGCSSGNSNGNTSGSDNAKTETKAAENKIEEGGDFVYSFATELNDFDPFAVITADARAVDFNIFEGLVKVDKDGNFVGAVAESYKVSDDAKTYTFKLRKGVKFHNGNEVTADDIKYSIKKAIDASFSGYNEIATYDSDSNGDFVITLNAPDSGFVAYLTTAIVPKDSTDLSKNPVGTGPFKFAEYVEQDHVKLEKNTDYWGTPAHLDSVTVKFASDQAAQVLDFKSGSIDGFSSSASTIGELEGDEFNQYVSNSNAVQLLALNNAKKPFDDVKIRQALNYLVDPDEIINTVNNGYGKKVRSGLIPALKNYYNDSLDSTYQSNVEKAKELLKEAGYENGFNFTIKVPSSYTVHVNTAEVIVNQLEKAGIHAEIKQVDWATWLDSVYKGRDFEATIISLDGALAYPTAFLSRYQKDSSSNFINFQSDNYDEAYKKAVSATNEEEKAKYFKEAQKVLNDEAASVYIQDISSIVFYNKKFEGYVPYPLYVQSFSEIYKVKE